MSVINRVLKDLDHQGNAAATPKGVQAVPVSARPTARPWPWLLAGMAVLAAGAWWFWPAPTTSKPAAPGPIAASTPAPEPVPLPEPQLRLSGQLSSPPLPKPVAPRQESPQPEAVAEPTQAAPVKAAEATAPAMPSVAAKLDTRLPQTPKPSVVKEMRPVSPQAQAETLWRQASRLVETGHGHDAVERLEAVLKLDPGHGAARQTLIALTLEMGGGERAEILLKQGLALHPGDPWYPRSLAQLHLQRGDYARAAEALKTGLGQNADAGYWGLYANTLAKLGRQDEAAPAYRQALRLDPAQGSWWIGLGVALERGERPGEAAEAYRHALQTPLSPELRAFASQKALELK